MTNDAEAHMTPTAVRDRRMERIEEKVDALETRVASVELNMAHTRELLTLQFTALQNGQNAVISKLDTMEAKITARELEGERAKSDPMATPAGRKIMEAIESIQPRVASIERKVWMGAGAFAALTIALQLFGPAFRTLLGLP